jgi:4-hydroxybenzoate polyprenyltransferase
MKGSRLAASATFDPAHLPYRASVLETIYVRRARGARIVLATASDERLARAIAAHLKVFDDVVATDGKTNLKGAAKLARIRDLLGGEPFAYAGDAAADLPIWAGAESAILINPSRSLEARAAGVAKTRQDHTYRTASSARRRTRRKHKCTKNLIVFVPLFTAHKLASLDVLRLGAGAFAAFCFFASSIYVLNDLLDLESDRAHDTKRNRPIPSGEITIPAALALMLGLFLSGLGISRMLPPAFFDVCMIYVGTTVAYSFVLKSMMILDVVALASLYSLRIFAGHAATDVKLSPWLIAFSMFFFMSLAFLKRYSELWNLQKKSKVSAGGREYDTRDIEQVAIFGTISGYMAVLVLALYVNSADVVRLYRSPQTLWFICPAFLYWLSRVWLLARRGAIPEDPVLYAITDRVSHAIAVYVVVVVMLAT